MNPLRKTVRFVAFFYAFVCLAAFSGTPAFAAEPEEDEAPGIPAYAISRLKVLAGSVHVRTPDSDWQEAVTNTPLEPNSRVSVPEGSEAELQFHAGQFVLLTSGTDIEIPEMSEERTRFRLRAGEIRFDLPGDDFAPVAVRIPGGARTRFDEPGRYWLTVTDEDTTCLVVRRGQANVAQEGETTRVLEGQEATIGRSIAVAQYKGASEPVSEPAPLTAQEREAGVPPVVSYELRDYGEWIHTPSHGYVWQPRVASDWSPYVYGQWKWITPYGWTWVSYEPWGWYPYHTGYWVTAPGFGWVWTPYGSFVSAGFAWEWGYYHQHRYLHHRNFYYRPANARFIPEGRNIRWAPLRPGERYRSPLVRSNDPRLQSWNRPLERGQVYVAQRGSGVGSQQWRDVREVRAERQRVVMERASTSPAFRRDMRSTRPELTRSTPSVAGPARSSTANGNQRAAERTPRRYPAQEGSPGPSRSSGAADAPRTTAPMASPSRTMSSGRGQPAPSASGAPSRSMGREAPSRETSSSAGRSSSTVERGNGFDRGGGGFDRGGGFSRGGGGGFGGRGGGRSR